MLPDYAVVEAQLTRLGRDQLRRLQDERLRTIVAYAYEASPFWRAKLEQAGLGPTDVGGIDDLRLLPFTTRAELDADQAEHPPFGSRTCAARDRWSGLFTTSGTSGRRLRRIVSRRDWELMVSRLMRGWPPPAGEIYMMLGPVDGMLGPSVGAEAARRSGAIVLLAGLWDTRTKVQAMVELRPAVISGVASYLVHIAEVAREMDVDPAALGVRMIRTAGEPGAAIPATRRRILDSFAAEDLIDGYGLTEVWPVGENCPHSLALHVPEDILAVECIDPSSGDPVEEGSPGEIVFTSLVEESQPLLRYRTRDIGRLTCSEPCVCGATLARIERIEGRTDDMIWYRGVNLFPSAVENVVRAQQELAPEYRILLDDGPGGLAAITVQVEPAARRRERDGALQAQVQAALRSALGITPEVELLAPGAIPRAERGKARRVLDRRAKAGVPAPTPGSRAPTESR